MGVSQVCRDFGESQAVERNAAQVSFQAFLPLMPQGPGRDCLRLTGPSAWEVVVASDLRDGQMIGQISNSPYLWVMADQRVSKNK